jgi:hypothetical protein
MSVTLTISCPTAAESLFELSQLAAGLARPAEQPALSDRFVEAVQEANVALGKNPDGSEKAECVTPKPEAPAEDKPKRARKAKEEKPQISTNPEDRVDPEVAAQDAADEAAEVAEQPAAPKATHDDVRAIMGSYARLYGMDAAMEDGVKILGVKKISDLTDDQIDGALAAGQQALEKNPFKRTPAA